MERTPLPISDEEEQMLTLVGLFLESVTGIHEQLNAALAQSGQLNETTFEPLLRLSRSEGGMLRMSDLSAQCRYTPSAITRTADRLEQLGYVERVSCPNDRRVTFLSITDSGRGAVESCLPGQVAAMRESIFATFDDAELDTLASLVRRLRDVVNPCATTASPVPPLESPQS